MGPIVDRSKEHLGTSDLPIIHMRRLLLEQVKAFQQGKENFILENGSLKNLYSAGLYDSNHKSWQEAFPMQDQFKKKEIEVKS